MLRPWLPTLCVLASCQPQLRGPSSSGIDNDEPLLQPSTNVVAWQIAGLTNKKKIPMQLVLTSKEPGGSGVAAGVRSNIIHTVALDPELRIRWLDDADCEAYLSQNFKPSYADTFRNEPRGSFRGDLCRAAVLYREGGFYVDLDLQLKTAVTHLVDEKTTFMSSFCADNAILNALVAAAPRCLVMRETLKELNKYMRDPKPADPEEDGTTSEWMGPLTMLRGLKAAAGQLCPEVVTTLREQGNQLNFTCGEQKFMLYREAELDCWSNLEECPEIRANSEFPGVRFGIFDMSGISQAAGARRLVGWPRYEGCTDWGCKSGGWEVRGEDKK